jgi:hypothetical protein
MVNRHVFLCFLCGRDEDVLTTHLPNNLGVSPGVRERTRDSKAVENKWIFKKKTDVDGNVTVYKA